MKEGEIPTLIWLSTLYLHCPCTLKRVKKPGWKQRRKKGCSPRNEKLLYSIWANERRTCRGNKANLHSLLPAVDMMEIAIFWLNRTTLTTCGYFHYYQEKRFFIFPQEEAPLGRVLGLWLKMCKRFVTVEPKFPKKPPLQNFKTQKPSNTFSVESCRMQRALLKPFLKQQSTQCCCWGSQNLGVWSI